NLRGILLQGVTHARKEEPYPTVSFSLPRSGWISSMVLLRNSPTAFKPLRYGWTGCLGMEPMARGCVLKWCSSTVLHPPSRLNVWPDSVFLRSPRSSLPRAIEFCNKLRHTDARSGGCSVDTCGRVSPRIRCFDSSGCFEGSGAGSIKGC